MIKIYQAF